MKKNQWLITILFITALCTSCINFQPKTRIDNPTDVTITVVIDGKKSFEIPPKQQIRIKTLSKGKHTMQLDGGEVITFELDTENAMLNPVLYPYILVREEYGTGEFSTHDFKDLEIDGITYTGPFTPLEGMTWINSKRFHYDVITPFPGEIHTKSGKNINKFKIFRVEDFIRYYEEEYTE
ncbi:MAG: hypothetical protein LIP08_00555 [Bacteroides sp.]|nr:hypothetical protein [Bacteroides sp.]